MATVVYALCGTGRGHTSRAMAVADALRARGHRVVFAAGDPAASALGEPTLPIPALRQVVRANRVRLWETARANWPHARHSLDAIAEAAWWLRRVRADVVVADHEPFVGRAARRVGVPVVALSRQLLLVHARPGAAGLGVAPRDALGAWGTARGIAVVAPPGAAATVIPTFHDAPLRRGSPARLVPPVLREDLLSQAATPGDRVLVYLNESTGMEPALAALGRVDAAFDVFGMPTGTAAPGNVTLHRPDRAAFLAHLGASRAVVATAGFTLLSEALHLGKPVLAVPNRGFFEQAVNARALVATGRGEAVRDLCAPGVAAFLDRAGRYAHPPKTPAHGRAGREAAADAVERVLAGACDATRTQSRLSWPVTPAPAAS